MERHTILFACVVLVTFGLCHGANTDIIHLDLSPIRGRIPSRPWMYPIGTQMAPSEKPVILCTDSRFPNDFSCDMRSFYASRMWRDRSAPDIYDFVLSYDNPTVRSDTISRIVFQLPRNSPEVYPLTLVYKRAEFGFNGEQAYGLNEGLPLANFTSMTVVTRRPDDYDFNCNFQFSNDGRTTVRRRGSRQGIRVVKFEYMTEGCVSPIAMGREEDPSDCQSDGRRCRPVSRRRPEEE